MDDIDYINSLLAEYGIEDADEDSSFDPGEEW